MNIFEFMVQSPILSFLLAYLILVVMENTFSRLFRAINIFRHGYPPSYCDADGDLKKDKKDEEDEG